MKEYRAWLWQSATVDLRLASMSDVGLNAMSLALANEALTVLWRHFRVASCSMGDDGVISLSTELQLNS